MKLIDLTCPSCGGKMQVNSELETVTCNFCGNQMLVDKEMVEQKITGGFDFGYEQEQGRLKALAEEKEKEEERIRVATQIFKNQKAVDILVLIDFLIFLIMFEKIFFANFVYHEKAANMFVTMMFFFASLINIVKDSMVIFLFEKKKLHYPMRVLSVVGILPACIYSVFLTKKMVLGLLIGIMISVANIILFFVIKQIDKYIEDNNVENIKSNRSQKQIEKLKNDKRVWIAIVLFVTIFCFVSVKEDNTQVSSEQTKQNLASNDEMEENTEDFWSDENMMVCTYYSIPDMTFYIPSCFMEYEDEFCAVPDDDYVSIIFYITSDGGNYEAKKDGFIEALFPSTETEYSRTAKSKIEVSIYEAEQQIFEDDKGNKAIITMVNHDSDDTMVTIFMIIDHDEYLENDYEAAYNFMIENVRYNDEEAQAEIFNETEEVGEEIDVTDNVPAQQSTSNVPEGVDPDLVAFLDAYEDFMDQYISFMYYYMNNPGEAMSLMYQYMQLLEMYDAYAEAIDKYNDTEMSDADVAYYTEVLLRIDAKLMSIY